MPRTDRLQILENVKPIVMFSQCLEHSACRYDGGIVKSDFIRRLKGFVESVTVCPEIEIGLGVPRDPVRLIDDSNRLIMIQPSTGHRLTQKMNNFSKSFVDSLAAIDGAILKSRSPSCGVGDTKIFQDKDSVKHFRKGNGLFAQAVIDRFTGIPIEDELVLKNACVREHFLVRLFTIARLRLAEKSSAQNSLRLFHEQHHDLFEVYNKCRLAILDRLLSTATKGRKSAHGTTYRAELDRMFARRTNRGQQIKNKYYPKQLQSV